MLGGEKDEMPVRGAPVPGGVLVRAEAKKSAENDVAGDQGGEESEDDGQEVAEVSSEEQSRGVKVFGLPGMAVGDQGLDQRKDKKDAIGEINVDHQAGNQAEQNPLEERARTARAIPVPEEKSNGKDGMCVRPGRIEIHVNGERAGAPNRKRGEKGPARFDVLPGERIGKKQAQEAVNRSAQGHSQEVRKGEAVGGDVRPQSVAEQDDAVGCKQEGRPQEGRSDREQVADVASFRVIGWQELAVGERALLSE